MMDVTGKRGEEENKHSKGGSSETGSCSLSPEGKNIGYTLCILYALIQKSAYEANKH